MLNNLINGGLGFANGVRVSAGMINGPHSISPDAHKASTVSRGHELHRVLHNSWRDRPCVCACLGMAAFEVRLFFMSFYLRLLFARSKRGIYLTIFHTSSLMGRLTAGVVSAYVSIPNAVVGCSFISSAVVFSIIGLRSVAGVALMGISYDYFLEVVLIALIAPLISYLTPEDLDIGVRIGISFTMSGIGSLFGAPICGVVLTSHYIWWRPAVLAGSIATCGTILLISMQFILKFRQKTAGMGAV
ncbi:hypothetical protein F4604DRAFT_1733259 [Suillus subluteus]|nr:hypothetical protein F4604DRAFT_1733259 [Suillus subluteus]